MPRNLARRFTMLVAAAAAALNAFVIEAAAADFTVGNIQIGNPWTRATPKGADVAGGYMKITNKGTVARQPHRRFVRCRRIASRSTRWSMVDGVMKMRPVARRSRGQARRDRRAQARIVPHHADGAQAAARKGPARSRARSFSRRPARSTSNTRWRRSVPGRRRRAGTVTAVDPFGHCGRRVVHTMTAIPTNPKAASGRPMYQRSRSRARACR